MIPSCHAGLSLCQQKVACGRNSTVPGIYFETEDGHWDCAPWSDTEDAAIVLFDYDRLLGNVELVMGGVSSRATLLLGDHLEQIVDHLLPAPFETNSRAVGVFIIRFRVERETGDGSGPHRAPPCERPPEIIPLAQQTLARRLRS